MLVHPRCPCSAASLEELDRVMARAGDRVAAQVVVVTPPGLATNEHDADLPRRAAAIRGVTVVHDANGVEADRFGVATSGQTLLYAADGRLLFAGGLTPSRGHEGDNAGRDAVLASLFTPGAVDDAASPTTPVYGCPLEPAAALQSTEARRG